MKDDDAFEQIIIRKRRGDKEEAHHGGVWKLAFADFMTAMMAFFLVMWLINSTSKETKAAIVQYFNPVQLIDSSPNTKGLHDPVENAQGKSSQKTDFQDAGAAPKPEDAAKDAAAEAALHKEPVKTLDEIAKRDPPPNPAKAAPAPTASASSGMGDPFDRMERAVDDQINNVAEAGAKKPPPPKAAAEHAKASVAPVPSDSRAKREAARANSIRGALEKIVAAEMQGKGGVPSVSVAQVDEGLLISLTDDANFSMFSVGSIEPKPQLVRILGKVGEVLAKQNGELEIRGHTDARTFKSSTYDNWRLSSDRATVAYYMLMRGKLAPQRVKKISGFADRQLKAPNDPNAAVNRRIEILLRGDQP